MESEWYRFIDFEGKNQKHTKIINRNPIQLNRIDHIYFGSIFFFKYYLFCIYWKFTFVSSNQTNSIMQIWQGHIEWWVFTSPLSIEPYWRMSNSGNSARNQIKSNKYMSALPCNAITIAKNKNAGKTFNWFKWCENDRSAHLNYESSEL